ncbi:hypothetical protein F1188_00500 [Roseospira marina]|uniref:Zinc finger CGNR domain-containing protein n=1 Tax=Roseospira marina TaxID=140057 RepID=A0A5M6II07_9PROT|nr:CGNR zinc finger domain-containing protein [Roseospira marina]KAA5607285.1 hypothetical protein F1188_00500 [Roseospira marina]MBB4312560.1 putative RNA-binding Zn ribbon-like protein [Roseospira marina]MBB5085424.1 putative RNA-binding Zn ribbon-like protein [Roseospira marina]
MHAWQQHVPQSGHIVLDFLNTIDDELKTRERNALPTWAVTLDWAERADLLTQAERTHLSDVPDGSDPKAVAAEHAALLDFRERLWTLLSGVAAEGAPTGEDRAWLADTVRWGVNHAELLWPASGDDSAIQWLVPVDRAGLATLRARLCVALGALLTRPDFRRLRECGRCTALYLNHGRGAGRRWCRMETCGNRAKIERFRGKR